MKDTSFLNLYKSGTIGLVVTGAAQIWLGLKGDPALFATGAATLAGVFIPAVAAKRLDGQIKTDVLTETSPLDSVTKGIDALTAARDQAVADFEKAADITASLSRGDLDPLVRELLK